MCASLSLSPSLSPALYLSCKTQVSVSVPPPPPPPRRLPLGGAEDAVEEEPQLLTGVVRLQYTRVDVDIADPTTWPEGFGEGGRLGGSVPILTVDGVVHRNSIGIMNALEGLPGTKRQDP